MRKLTFHSILLICVLLSGCTLTTSEYFGIRTNNPSGSSINITSYDNGHVNYSSKPYASSDVYAFADYWGSDKSFHFRIYNDSKTPININYFGDKYALYDINGNEYELQKSHILNYPKETVINPGSSVDISAMLNTMRKLENNEIKFIILELGSLRITKLELHQLPQTDKK